MAITLVSSSAYKEGFFVNGYSADFSGCEVLLAAQGAGTHIYLEALSISCASGITITIGEGESSSAVVTVIVGPIIFTAAGSNNYGPHKFARPIQLSANTALTVDASGAGPATVMAEGFVE